MRAAVIALLLCGCATFHWQPLPATAQAHRAKTADGWELAMVRYPATVPSTGRPVLLVHGIAANARNMDLDEHHSLARWLASQGREAWSRWTQPGERSGPMCNLPFGHRTLLEWKTRKRH